MLYTSDKVATCALSGKCLGSLLHLLLQCILGDKILADCKPEVKTLDVIWAKFRNIAKQQSFADMQFGVFLLFFFFLFFLTYSMLHVSV